jgi:ParB family chromosome partitioning protein
MRIINILIDKIEQNENSRTVYKASDLTELMLSMKEDGLLQPIGVRDLGKGKYECVFGNRRLLAAKKLGWIEIPANLIEAEEEKDRDILGLVENFKRQNTTVEEDGRIFLKLKDSGMTITEIAARLGIAPVRVETALDVYSHFPKEFRKSIVNGKAGAGTRSGKISASVATSINNIRKQYNLNRDRPD